MNQLTSIQSFRQAIQHSSKEKIIIFKHSVTCAISSHAMSEISKLSKEYPNIPIYMLTIQETGGLKQIIAQELDIPHESPQVLLLKNGKVQSVLNHWDIAIQALEAALSE